jgi:wyosine [tRNA(Phe)-imidazoG37] synthetase (radical SAM superfamily)
MARRSNTSPSRRPKKPSPKPRARRAPASGARLVFADAEGNLYDHPTLEAAVCVTDQSRRAEPGTFRPLPSNGASASVSALPGRLPVGFDRKSGKLEVLDSVVANGKKIRPVAVAALFPPGWTRTHLPAFYTSGLAPVLPLYGYAAAGWKDGALAAAGLRTDPRDHWDPALYSTADLKDRVEKRIAEDPTNRVLLQTARCALDYRCFTAQNVFYRRWEGAIPMSSACNAQCVGCISEQDPETGPPPSQWRIAEGPSVEECVRMAVPHLERGEGRIVSFGQGCEGEPTLRADAMAEVCREVRKKTAAGTLHVNTNGSRPEVWAPLRKAGLDSCRVSLNAAEKTVYESYYRPTGYTWEHVAETVREAKRVGLFVSLNLLVFPGVSDSPAQAKALVDFVADARPDCIQTRNLCIDPASYLGCLPEDERGEEPIGMTELLRRLVRARPGIKIGNYNVPREDWELPLLASDVAALP